MKDITNLTILTSEKQKLLTKTYIVFQLEEKLYALNTNNIKNIIELRESHLLKKCNPLITEYTLFKEKNFFLIDIKRKLKIKNNNNFENACILHLKSIANFNDCQLGIVVDKIMGIYSFDNNSIKNPENFINPIIKGFTKNENAIIRVLDIYKVIDKYELTFLFENKCLENCN